MIVYLLTEEQKNELTGVEYTDGCMFNPINDADGNWIISVEEVQQCSIDWVKKLKKIEFVKKQEN